MDTPLAQLSDGYKRRVALAAQLARQPSLLLLDEPLAGVDWPTRASLAALLGKAWTLPVSVPFGPSQGQDRQFSISAQSLVCSTST